MKSLWIYLMLIATLLVAGSQTSIAQTPEQLYQKGLMKEEGEGELKDAINLYNQIAANTDADQSLRAKALLHIGLCHERMGTEEAVKAYQRLLNSFPRQKNEVAIAKERLNHLLLSAESPAEIPVQPKFIKIRIPTKLYYNSLKLSPNGKKLGYVSDEKMWIMPLSGPVGPDFTGKPVLLNTNGIEIEYTGFCWSHDGEWIAFNGLAANPDSSLNQRIYVVPTAGGNPREVIENYRDFRRRNYGISLSPDGQNIAYTSVSEDQQHLFQQQVKGGFQTLLTEMQAREPAYSNDGKLIAFVEDQNLGQGGGNLWIAPADVGPPRLIAKATNASSPVWSPDNSMIAYLDLDNPRQINVVPVDNKGNITGKISRILVPNGVAEISHLAGWTPDNTLGAICSRENEFGLYTLPVEGGQAAMIMHQDYLAVNPRWTPEEEKIVYTTSSTGFSDWQFNLTLASVPATGGSGNLLLKKREEGFFHPMPPQSGTRFSPDGTSIAVSGWIPGDTVLGNQMPATRIWTVSSDGSHLKRISDGIGLFIDNSPSWSPAGNKIAFGRWYIKEGSERGQSFEFENYSVYMMNPDGSDAEELFTSENPILYPLWSPDGTMIAYISRSKDSGFSLHTYHISSGESKFIYNIPEFWSPMDPCWSPNSREIAYINGALIKILDIKDGSIREIETSLPDDIKLLYLDWSPDGNQFVFGGWRQGLDEFWMIENYLPLEKLPQSPESTAADKLQGITIKQVWTGIEADNTGSVSNDGNYLSFVDWETGDLAIKDLAKGTSRRLTNEGTLEDRYLSDQFFAYSSKFSPDNKQIAYAWFNNLTFELRIIEIDNSFPRILYRNNNESIFPEFWLSNGKILIAKRYLNGPNGTKTQIVSIGIPDGSVNVLKTIDFEYQLRICPALDNRYIAYEYPSDLSNENYDIHLLCMDGTSETPLTNHPSNDRLLGWVPDNNRLLFTSNRSGSWDLWSVEIENGKLSGLPVRILPEIGDISPLGSTKEGSFYYSIFSRMFTGLITSFKMETGIAGQEESKRSIPGSVKFVEWSPDGESLAYGKEEKRMGDYFCKLYVLDLTTGLERCFPENFNLYNNSIRWSPDTHTILAVGFDETKRGQKNYRGGVYTFDTRTGKMNEVLLMQGIANVVNPLRLTVAEWSPDGKSIYYLNYYPDGDKIGYQIIKHESQTGEEKVIYNGDNFNNLEYLKRILRLSPASENLLFAYADSESKKVHLCTIPLEGGHVKEICTSQETDRLATAVWSPDGKSIYFTETPTLDYSKLWRVSAAGGTPQYICQLPHLDVCLSIHPSGQKVALTYGEQKTEVRVMENLTSEIAKVFSENE